MTVEGLRVNGPENRNFLADAEARLLTLGLSLKDLARYDHVLDIGAADCAIERASLSLGRRNVTSVDRKFSLTETELAGLNVMKIDAADLSLSENSVDIILVTSSAYKYTRTEKETLKILFGLNRVLRIGGKQLVHPARFGHIVEDLKRIYPEFDRAVETERHKRSAEQAKIIIHNNTIADQQTLSYLRENNIFARKLKSHEPHPLPSFEHYLEIPKFRC